MLAIKPLAVKRLAIISLMILAIIKDLNGQDIIDDGGYDENIIGDVSNGGLAFLLAIAKNSFR